MPIIGLNGESLGLGITYESGPLPIVIRDYFEVINFDITGLGEPISEYLVVESSRLLANRLK